MKSTEIKWHKNFDEESLSQEIAQAKARSQLHQEIEPCAQSAHYDPQQDLVIIYLKSGAIFSFPPKLVQGLDHASPEDLSDLWIDAAGQSIHWERLDVDFSIPHLLAGIFGTKNWMQIQKNNLYSANTANPSSIVP
jgi:hypothetical protein